MNIFANGVVPTPKNSDNNLFANSVVTTSRRAGGGTKGEYRVGIVQYKDGVYYVKLHNGDIIPIDEQYTTLKDVILVFSLPDNVNHMPGTARKLKSAIKEEYWFMYDKQWGKYKIGEKLKGNIENNKFIPK
jgi:hypothetical protein